MSTGATHKRGLAMLDLLHSRSQEHAHSWRRQVGAVFAVALVGAAVALAWAALAPLAGAVIAPAQVKVEHRRQTVQHQEGGIVRQILVRDGQRVRSGDALLVLGDARQEAELATLEDQLRGAKARAARADAEARLASRLDIPDSALGDPAGHFAREQAVFAARRQVLVQQAALLHSQVQLVRSQAAALESQLETIDTSGRLADEELAINENLAGQGFVSRTRLIALQRSVSDYRSRRAEVASELALARQRIPELQGRVAQLQLGFQAQASDELKDAAVRVRELEQRLLPSRDLVERQIVRAPVDGDVMSLRVGGPGTVIAPREPLLDVVPAFEKLVVDARIEPQDIEHVHVGGAAEVRLITADARRLPLLPARITFVSSDRVTQGETGRAWFDATVEIDASELERRQGRQGPLVLKAGMPAELYVTTPSRTLVEYLGKPLLTFAHRGLREPG
jgi:HlyD family type I secretion membrane fusion protein